MIKIFELYDIWHWRGSPSSQSSGSVFLGVVCSGVDWMPQFYFFTYIVITVLFRYDNHHHYCNAYAHTNSFWATGSAFLKLEYSTIEFPAPLAIKGSISNSVHMLSMPRRCGALLAYQNFNFLIHNIELVLCRLWLIPHLMKATLFFIWRNLQVGYLISVPWFAIITNFHFCKSWKLKILIL